MNRLFVCRLLSAVVSVARRREGFAQTSGGVVRVRRGTHDDPLFGAELVRFANERTSSRYETTQLGIQIDAAVGELRREIGRALGWDRATVARLREAELAVDDRLTVAGALYLLTDPSQALGKAFVEVLRFPDDATVDYDRRTEIRGPVHQDRTAGGNVLGQRRRKAGFAHQGR